MNVNHVTLGGNITKDPETRYLPSGTAVVDFTIAVNRSWKDKSGESQKEASFIRCTAFAKTAELVAQYLAKGSPILVEGRIKTESWEKDGQKRSATKVIVEKLHFVGPRKEKEAASEFGGQDDGGPFPGEEQT